MMAHARLLQEKEKHKIEIGAIADKCASTLEHERIEMQRKMENQSHQYKLDLEREAATSKEKAREIREQAER